MPYKKLYNRRQAEADWLPLSWYVKDAGELSWVNNAIQIKRTKALPKSHLRGMIIQHNTGFMPHALEFRYTIFVAHGLTPEFERFVVIKELMHLYFGPSGGGIYATDNPITLENHMQEMFAASADIQSHQVKAEKEALWMAIAVITPDKAREQFRQDVAAGNMPVANVASILHIPVHTTKALLSNQFYHEISSIME